MAFAPLSLLQLPRAALLPLLLQLGLVLQLREAGLTLRCSRRLVANSKLNSAQLADARLVREVLREHVLSLTRDVQLVLQTRDEREQLTTRWVARHSGDTVCIDVNS